MLSRPEVGLWAVADGMGGHAAGDFAAQAITEGLVAIRGGGTLAEYVDAVDDLLCSVNAALRDHSERCCEGRTVGSTVVTLISNGAVGVVLWAGDSRLYRLRDDELLQVTRDHNPRLESKDGRWHCFPPLIAGGIAYFTSHHRHMYIVDIHSSKLTDTFRAENGMCSSPSRHEGTIFFSDWSGHVYAMDARTHQVRWRFKAGAKVDHAPALYENTAYFSSHDHFVYAVVAATGEEQWRFQSDDKVSSEPAVHEGIVYFNTLYSHLYAIDARTGGKIWDIKKDGMVYSRPVIAGNTLYFGSGDRNLYALHARTGEEKWRFKAGNMVCNPTVWEGMVFFGDATGNTL